MQRTLSILCLFWLTPLLLAGQIDDKTTVKPVIAKKWTTFRLDQVRLLPESPFYNAMTVAQQFLLDTDIEKMIPRQLRSAKPYPGSDQPGSTRSVDCPHYISGVSLMYAQTGDKRFLERSNYLIDKFVEAKKSRKLVSRRVQDQFNKILNGNLTLAGPDEFGYPWGGMGNFFYGIHKWMAAYRDAYLYCDNQEALDLLIEQSEPLVDFVLKANPDLFDGMLDIEHGGMNEVFADLYAITGDKRYLAVSMKFNHQKVILNLALNKDVLSGRHANMQVPTFVGTARQYQLTGNKVSFNATANFLETVYHNHMTCIGGNSRYERFGPSGDITSRLGYTSCETCNTYNMLKVALEHFQYTGDLNHMDYYERGLYNHILASQAPDSGGVTYYTSLAPGGFKTYSDRFNLSGVWCCVGTGMENHSKYGRAIYFHNQTDLLVNLFIPSTLSWQEKGLSLKMETRFPASNEIILTVLENDSFNGKIQFRYPAWASQKPLITKNNAPVESTMTPQRYIQIAGPWQKGDMLTISIPMSLHLEQAGNNPDLNAIMYGPLVLAGQLGQDRMPPSDRVNFSLAYKNWHIPTDDIPIFIKDTQHLSSWIRQDSNNPLHFTALQGNLTDHQTKDVDLLPYYQTHHQRYNLYWYMYTPEQYAARQKSISDLVDCTDIESEKAHQLSGKNHTSATIKDSRHFWENNLPGRLAKDGGSFSYQLNVKNDNQPLYLVITYWGGADKNTIFDIKIDGELLTSDNISQVFPLCYYNKTYAIPAAMLKGKKSITLSFHAEKNHNAGPVFNIVLTDKPELFKSIPLY